MKSLNARGRGATLVEVLIVSLLVFISAGAISLSANLPWCTVYSGMIRTRRAVADDLSQLKRQLTSWPEYRPCLLDTLNVEAYRRAAAELWTERLTSGERDLVACEGDLVTGYAALAHGVDDPLCGVRQTAILDWIWRDSASALKLVRGILQRARVSGDEIVTALVSEADLRMQDILQGAAFVPEIVRVRKRLESGACIPPPNGYRVRPAGSDDRTFMLWLIRETLLDSVPHVRRLGRERVWRGFTRRYTQQDLPGSCHWGWILEDTTADDEPCGFLTLEQRFVDRATGRKPAYVVDIAVHPDHWGSGAGPWLMQQAEADMWERGIRTVYGDVSIDNPRPLSRGTRSLAYETTGRQWVRILDA